MARIGRAFPAKAIVGRPLGVAGGLTISPGAIGSLEAFGTGRLDLNAALTAIASAEAFGTARLDFSLLMAALASAEAFGTARFDLNIAGAGAIASGEAHGAQRLDFEIAAAGIAGVEAFGTPQLDLLLLMQAIASGEAFGTVDVQGGVQIQPSSLPSSRARPAAEQSGRGDEKPGRRGDQISTGRRT